MNDKGHVNFTDTSRWDWGNSQPKEYDLKNLAFGCLQRIADALETIAEPIGRRQKAEFDRTYAADEARWVRNCARNKASVDAAISTVRAAFKPTNEDERSALRKMIGRLEYFRIMDSGLPANFEPTVEWFSTARGFGKLTKQRLADMLNRNVDPSPKAADQDGGAA